MCFMHAPSFLVFARSLSCFICVDVLRYVTLLITCVDVLRYVTLLINVVLFLGQRTVLSLCFVSLSGEAVYDFPLRFCRKAL